MAKGKRRASGGHNRTKSTPHRQRKQPPRNAKRLSHSSSRWTSSNSAKIEEYMTSHGVIRKPIIGDGNCLFRAMADQLGYGESRHREIRDKIVETIGKDKEYFANFIDEEEIDGVEAYCEEMTKDGVWGDDIELEAFRRAYGRAIVIYDASTGTPYVKPYNGDEGTSLNAVHLWKSECHYESVRNRDGPFDGPSRVMYKDIKVSDEEVEKIKKQHEDAVVEELRIALPHIHLTEIRRLVKEHEGDGNKVLEFLTSVEPQEPQLSQSDNPSQDLPNGIPIPNESKQDSQQDPLSPSMELLSLNLDPPQQSHTPSTPLEEDSIPTPVSFSTTDFDDPKHKARQRRHASAARKDKQTKRAQKDAAKRRKRMEAMGIERMDDTSTVQEHILKAIVI